MTPKAVVFDIGNVLVGWNPAKIYADCFGVERQRQVFSETPLLQANLDVDNGAPFLETFATLAQEYPEFSKEIAAWPDLWPQMFGPVIDGSVALLRQLRAAGVTLYALTNFGDETFEIAQNTHDFLNEFDVTFVSGRLQVMKPLPEIYEIVEQATGLSGGELFFTDDSAPNIAAAKDRGWNAHLFTSPAALEQQLKDAGLLK